MFISRLVAFALDMSSGLGRPWAMVDNITGAPIPDDFYPTARKPGYGEEELLDLASNIAANGLRNPIVLYQGQILDGVNRHQVCLAAYMNETNRRPFKDSMFKEYEGSVRL